MQRIPPRFNQSHRAAPRVLLPAAAFMVAACAGIVNVSSAVGSAATAAAAVSGQAGSQATPAAVAGGAQCTARCQTIGEAYFDFRGVYRFLGLASDSAKATNTPDSPTHVNIAKLRSDLDVLATLPDGPLGLISPAVAQFRQLVDQVDANIKSGGKPFSDGSGNGQKVLDRYLKLAVPYTVVAEAFGTACPHFTPATAAPDAAGYQIGQTASVGDLRVTPDKVTEAPLDPPKLPTSGHRFLLVHVTIQNVGQSALPVTGLSETNLKDAAGTSYGFDLFANSLAAVGSDNGLGAEIPAGARMPGWWVTNCPQPPATYCGFSMTSPRTESSLRSGPAPWIPATPPALSAEDALRNSAGATMTALFGLVATSHAADMTATVAP